jgi:hypothetical protein
LAEQYDICFDLINGAQLDLENIARDVQTSKKAFSKPKDLVENLWAMDSYLNDLIGEYEESRNRFAGDLKSLPLNDLTFLEDFLAPARASRFKDAVVVPYHEVQSAIREDLMHPYLASASTRSKSDS